jgi:hypothetical protein
MACGWSGQNEAFFHMHLFDGGVSYLRAPAKKAFFHGYYNSSMIRVGCTPRINYVRNLSSGIVMSKPLFGKHYSNIS